MDTSSLPLAGIASATSSQCPNFEEPARIPPALTPRRKYSNPHQHVARCDRKCQVEHVQYWIESLVDQEFIPSPEYKTLQMYRFSTKPSCLGIRVCKCKSKIISDKWKRRTQSSHAPTETGCGIRGVTMNRIGISPEAPASATSQRGKKNVPSQGGKILPAPQTQSPDEQMEDKWETRDQEHSMHLNVPRG